MTSLPCYRYLTASDEPNCFYLLGYPLRLSPTESAVLYKLLTEVSLSVDELCVLPTKTLSKRCLAVHVHAINQKAMAISDRRLILFFGDSYRLSHNM